MTEGILDPISTTEFITVIILEVTYGALFVFLFKVMLFVNKKTEKWDVSINMMLLFLQLAALFNVADFFT